jgi:hypothetical protein
LFNRNLLGNFRFVGHRRAAKTTKYQYQ